jgi:hypothetical protein
LRWRSTLRFEPVTSNLFFSWTLDFVIDNFSRIRKRLSVLQRCGPFSLARARVGWMVLPGNQ